MGRYRRQAGWKRVFDPGMWVRAFLVEGVGVVSMATLACGFAPVRDTTGHDRYATGKPVHAETPIELRFDECAPVASRRSRGEVLTLTCDDLKHDADALLARGLLSRTARNAADLGGGET